MTSPILPGSVIGVLGSGQLGRMMTIAARRLGYQIEVFSPERNTPAGQVADVEWVTEYDDNEALTEFAKGVDVVTLEFENVPSEAISIIEHWAPVRPGAETIFTAQNRFHEKSRLQKMGLPTAPFRLVRTAAELSLGVSDYGGEGILKTTTCGYDGKGQFRLTSCEQAHEVWEEFAQTEGILEGIVDFASEFSVIGVRGIDGEFRAYDPILNQHVNHILDVSVSPAQEISPPERAEAIAMTQTVMEELDTIGVLCVEFFQTQDGSPIINEIAPRPHNSGHLTIDAHMTCQFEQQVRAVCGLPLGSTAQRQPAAMANLLGDIWEDNTSPDWSRLLTCPTAKLHLYGKACPKSGRKMGHITTLASQAATAETIAREARQSLESHSVQRTEVNTNSETIQKT